MTWTTIIALWVLFLVSVSLGVMFGGDVRDHD